MHQVGLYLLHLYFRDLLVWEGDRYIMVVEERSVMELKDYKELLIQYPEGGEDPFEYTKGDKPYFIWLSNRTKNCTLLDGEEILDAVNKYMRGELNLPPELNGGYTALFYFERLFLLHIGDVKYADTLGETGELLFCKEGIREEDLEADTFLFVYKGREYDVRTTELAWKWNPKLIKELTGKDKYSISDARKIIHNIRNGADSIYACIGVKTIEKLCWH